MKNEGASMRYRARQWAHSEPHSPLKLDKEQDRTRFESFSKKNMFAGQISYFGFFKIAWWSAIFFS